MDRAELIESALVSLPEGVAVLDQDCRVIFWNHAAELMTGYAGVDLIGRSAPEGIDSLLHCRAWPAGEDEEDPARPGRGAIVHARHKQGRDVPFQARALVLRDDLGKRIGTSILFHITEHAEVLPHGMIDDKGVQHSQEEVEERLETAYAEFMHGWSHCGVLWVMVDQAHELRKTHGAKACESMMEKIERTLVNGLRLGEELGRWGMDEFLVISRERSLGELRAHAGTLAGLARTADFRWWGDRVSLTVSIGVAQVEEGETLNHMLERAQMAMVSSVHAGGNQITAAAGGTTTCSPS